jgi:hypothetical protein
LKRSRISFNYIVRPGHLQGFYFLSVRDQIATIDHAASSAEGLNSLGRMWRAKNAALHEAEGGLRARIASENGTGGQLKAQRLLIRKVRI